MRRVGEKESSSSPADGCTVGTTHDSVIVVFEAYNPARTTGTVSPTPMDWTYVRTAAEECTDGSLDKSRIFFGIAEH